MVSVSYMGSSYPMYRTNHLIVDERVQVHAGASLRAVLAELARAQAVPEPRLVEWYLRLHGDNEFQRDTVFQRLEHAIGCERCHGPGELHVRGDMEHTIVNPARLSPPLRDAVCEQCHLEGEARLLRAGRDLFDYRPGLPLADFWSVLVEARRSGEDAKAVNHVEQMYQSKCFQRPVGALQCGIAEHHLCRRHDAPDALTRSRGGGRNGPRQLRDEKHTD